MLICHRPQPPGRSPAFNLKKGFCKIIFHWSQNSLLQPSITSAHPLNPHFSTGGKSRDRRQTTSSAATRHQSTLNDEKLKRVDNVRQKQPKDPQSFRRRNAMLTGRIDRAIDPVGTKSYFRLFSSLKETNLMVRSSADARSRHPHLLELERLRIPLDWINKTLSSTLTVGQVHSDERTKCADCHISTFRPDTTFQDAVNDVSNGKLRV